jgi:hypothetical protein
MKKAMIALLCAAAAGCASQDQVSSQTMEQAVAPLTCTRKAQCDAWWQRAQVWISNHSAYKILTVTDSIIQTDGPSASRRDLAYEITKTPNNDGSATIGFAAHCNNMLGCLPNPWEAGANFKQFVRHGPAMQSAPGASTRPPSPGAAPIRTAPVEPVVPATPAAPAGQGEPIAPDSGSSARIIQ